MPSALQRLEDLVLPVGQWNPRLASPDGSILYIDLGAVDQGSKQVTGARRIRGAEAPTRARQIVFSGDVLVSTVRPNLNAVARLSQEFDGATASTGFCVLRPQPDRLDSDYLFHWVRESAFIDEMVRLATGASYPAVSDDTVFSSRLPVPPLPEQRRIAAILDQADVLRAKRREALAKLDELTQAIFLDMFGDPATNPKGWPVMPFGQICDTRLGKMLDKKQQTGLHNRLYLRNANVQWFKFDLSDVAQMDFDTKARGEFRLESGDLLICEGGEPGRAAVWRGELTECYFQKALHRARPDPMLANAEFLCRQLWFLARRGRLLGVTSATIAHLTGEKLAVLPVVVPPIALQVEFSDMLEQVRGISDFQVSAIGGLEALFNSLQHRAFRGEL